MLLQVAVVIETTLSLPGWVDQIALVLLALGLPVVLLLAWAQESGASVDGGAGTEAGRLDAVGSAVEWPAYSIAVLPFDDLSRDGSFQEVADGISEDILTGLSFYDFLSVAARNSSFVFKGSSTDVRDIGKQLDVRFVLEGSFRKVGENVRITVQLNETLTGAHAWSERFDRPMETLDSELDEVAEKVVIEVSGNVADREQKRLMALDPATLSASDLTCLARDHLAEATLENAQVSERLMQVALEKAPDDAKAQAVMAHIQALLPISGSRNRAEHWRLASEHLSRAKSSGRPDFETLIQMAWAAFYMGNHTDLEIYAGQMRGLGPNNAASWGVTAMSHLSAGRFEECLPAFDRGKALTSLRSPFGLTFLSGEALAHLALRNFAQAEKCSRQYLSARNAIGVRQCLVVALAHQGKLEEAVAELETVKASMPGKFNLAIMERSLRSLWTFGDMADIQVEGLQMAGLE